MFERFSKAFALKTFNLPVESPPIQIVQVWHKKNHHDPHHRWLREQVRSVLNDTRDL